MTHLYLLPRPILFAHRGASASAPENTLAAFRLAVRQGAPAIELDVKLSADGQVMVFHDPTVNRTTDGTGFVHRLPLAELRAAFAQSGTSFRNVAVSTGKLPQIGSTVPVEGGAGAKFLKP